jgi:3',5'-cyclic AMP phosphodiesterase CpdA
VTQFRLAHLSDPHLPMEGMSLRLRDYFSKRFLSYISWQMNRRHKYRPEILNLVTADIAAQNPDHVVVTGDLCNLSLPAEFAQAQAWLENLGTASHVTTIPGNHDALVASPDIANGFAAWRPWMGSEHDASPAPHFPFIRRCGDIALISVNTAMPTLPFMATGKLGPDQLMRLKEALLELRAQGLCRILLIHHPVTDNAAEERKQLKDRAQLRGILHEVGAELVLHGHTHETAFRTVPGPEGEIPIISVPSASARATSADHRAGWNLLTFTRETSAGKFAWKINVKARRMDSGQMREVEQHNYLQPTKSQVKL